MAREIKPARTEPLKTKFFHFGQNNTHGTWVNNDDVSEEVIIEALNADDANHRAEAIGIYFDGCSSGQDCPCCGDRWYPTSDKGTDKPEVYGKPAEEFESSWMKEPVTIHYLDGRVVKCGIGKK